MSFRSIRRKWFRAFLTGFFLPVLICVSPIGVNAENLTHTHNDGCFVTEEAECTNHDIVFDASFTDGWCDHCKQTIYGYLVYYYEICNSGYKEKEYTGTMFLCSGCNKYSGKWRDYILPHKVSERKIGCGQEEGEVLAEVSMSQNISEWTRDNVVLTVNVTPKSGSFSPADKPFDYGNGAVCDNTVTVTENGSYGVTVTDKFGNCASAGITVSNIDRKAPSVTLSKSTEGWTQSGLNIIVNATDSGSGLAALPFSFNNGDFTAKNEFHTDTNGTVTVSVRDVAGNVATASIVVDNIGRDPKIVAEEQAAIERERAAREEAVKAEAERKKAEEEAERARLLKQKEQAELEKAKSEAKRAAKKAAKEDAEQAKTEKTDKEVSENDKKDSGEESGNLLIQTEQAAEKEEGILIAVTDISTVSDAESEEPALIDEQETAKGMIASEEVKADSGELYDVRGETFELSPEDESFLTSVGNYVLKAGCILAIAGCLFFSFFNYVYISKNGKKRLVTLVKVNTDDRKVTVSVPEGKLERGSRYLIYYSPWAKRKMGQKSIYVSVGDDGKIINTDEGVAFTY